MVRPHLSATERNRKVRVTLQECSACSWQSQAQDTGLPTPPSITLFTSGWHPVSVGSFYGCTSLRYSERVSVDSTHWGGDSKNPNQHSASRPAFPRTGMSASPRKCHLFCSRSRLTSALFPYRMRDAYSRLP